MSVWVSKKYHIAFNVTTVIFVVCIFMTVPAMAMQNGLMLISFLILAASMAVPLCYFSHKGERDS